MSTFLIALTFAALPVDDEQNTRTYHEINRDIRQFMSQETRAKTDEERAAAIRNLAKVYLEIKQDPRLREAPTLQKYKAKVWSRLVRIKKEIEQQLARKKAKQRSVQSPTLSDEQLLQDAEIRQASESMAAQMTLVSNSIGGPGKLFSMAGSSAFGGGAFRDGGEDLVELITRVIEPDFWDVNGGPGTIFYYPAFHALVVRATSEVHRKIGGGLGGLRK